MIILLVSQIMSNGFAGNISGDNADGEGDSTDGGSDTSADSLGGSADNCARC